MTPFQKSEFHNLGVVDDDRVDAVVEFV